MSHLIAFCALPGGHVEGLVADVEETVDGERCFRCGPDLVLRLPARSPAAVRLLEPRPAPTPRFDLLRSALRAQSVAAAASDHRRR